MDQEEKEGARDGRDGSVQKSKVGARVRKRGTGRKRRGQGIRKGAREERKGTGTK